jgi:hypothetical protein
MASFIVDIPVRVRRDEGGVIDVHLQRVHEDVISIPIEAHDEHEAVQIVRLSLAMAGLGNADPPPFFTKRKAS